jgi:hypothetical protein
MEQWYALKEYGNLSLFEQNSMTGEERAWWIKRIEKEHKRREEQAKSTIPRRS